MKIIYVLHSHKVGGAERHLLQLMQSMSLKGAECIYAGPMDGWLGEQVLGLGFRHEHIPYHGFFDLASLVRLIRMIRREKADLVHGHLTRGAFYAGWAGRLTSLPVVATAHSTNAGKHFGRCDRIIAVADAVNRYLSSCGYPRNILRTVHNGVPDYSARLSLESVDLISNLNLDDVPVLAMVARFVSAKGHDLALRALASLRDRPWVLLLAGATDTDWADDMKQLAAQLGIENRVHFLGHFDDVTSIYACTDILLAPSRREALSLTLLEAASFRIPIVATNVGGNGEAVINGKTGLLVHPENPADLAKAICRLLDNADMRLEMGKAGRQRYEELFSVETMEESIMDVYQELTATRG